MDERTAISGLYLSWAQGTALYVKYAELRRVSYSELMVLDMMLEAGRLTQRELSLRCELTKQTVNQTVKKLRESGYLVMENDPSDRRRKVLAFTEAGRRHAVDIAEPLRQMEAQVFQAVGPERMAAMKETSDLFNWFMGRELARFAERKP